jgi:hypothetical protein
MATSAYFKELMKQLKCAAGEARASGDIAAAEAIEAQISKFQADAALDGRLHGLKGEATSVDAKEIRKLWAGVNADRIHSARLVCVLDCGARGAITFVGGAILITGSVALEPKTALLIGRHANKFDAGGGLAFGSPEFLFNISVANAVTGSKIALDGGAKADAGRVADVARHWRPLLVELDTPARPALPRVAVSAPAAQVPAAAG